jgi:ABC-type multidrug transport system ATPase subunit
VFDSVRLKLLVFDQPGCIIFVLHFLYDFVTFSFDSFFLRQHCRLINHESSIAWMKEYQRKRSAEFNAEEKQREDDLKVLQAQYVKEAKDQAKQDAKNNQTVAEKQAEAKRKRDAKAQKEADKKAAAERARERLGPAGVAELQQRAQEKFGGNRERAQDDDAMEED